HHVFCSRDGNFVEVNVSRAQTPITRGARHDVTGFEFYFRAKRFKRRQMQIYWPRSDCTTAGQRDFRFAETREQWSKREHRRAHRLHELVRCFEKLDVR